MGTRGGRQRKLEGAERLGGDLISMQVTQKGRSPQVGSQDRKLL